MYPYVGNPMVHINQHVPHKGVNKEFFLGGPPSFVESMLLSKKRNHFGSTRYVLPRTTTTRSPFSRKGRAMALPSSTFLNPIYNILATCSCDACNISLCVPFSTSWLLWLSYHRIYEAVVFHLLGQLPFMAICQWDKYVERELLQTSVPLIHPSLKGSKAWAKALNPDH